jgi:alpha-tubulin suppressor-like RCC1 family protein
MNNKEIERDDYDKILAISCGTNHTISLTTSGQAFSWGYSGKALLGRSI